MGLELASALERPTQRLGSLGQLVKELFMVSGAGQWSPSKPRHWRAVASEPPVLRLPVLSFLLCSAAPGACSLPGCVLGPTLVTCAAPGGDGITLSSRIPWHRGGNTMIGDHARPSRLSCPQALASPVRGHRVARVRRVEATARNIGAFSGGELMAIITVSFAEVLTAST